MFLKQRQATLEKYSEILIKVDSYQKSVYATWYMSYKMLSTRAQQLLWLMAYLHHDNITEDIFQHAAKNSQKYSPIIPECAVEIEAREYVEDHLKFYLDSTGAWDTSAFLTVMSELMAYSLIDCDRVNAVYTLHVLVHDWASTVIPQPATMAVQQTMLLLALSISSSNTTEELAFKRALEIHVSRVLEGEVRPSTHNAAQFAEVYRHTGRWRNEQTLELAVLDACGQELGEEHPSTLQSMEHLAIAYHRQGRYEQAETLQVQVLGIRKRVLGEEHPDTLCSMGNLALTHCSQGRYEQAETLQVQVLGIRKRVFGEEHPDTLGSMGNLAFTHCKQGRYEQAETLQVQLLGIHKRVLREEHSDTLTSMGNLAATYCSQGRYEQAETLQVQVLDGCKRMLGPRHPTTLTVMCNLARTYRNMVPQRRREEEVLCAQLEELETREEPAD
jgi:tetratricopeptide (TPR) repeat protein